MAKTRWTNRSVSYHIIPSLIHVPLSSDFYFITWFPVDNPDDLRAKEIPGDIQTEGIDRMVKILIGSLLPGVKYHFKITTKSHDLSSNTITKIIRTQPLCTSEIFIINDQEVSTALTLRYTPTPKQKTFATHIYND